MCDQQSLRSACAYAQSDKSLCLSLEYSMIVTLLTEHHLEFLSPSLHLSNCLKSHAAAQLIFYTHREVIANVMSSMRRRTDCYMHFKATVIKPNYHFFAKSHATVKTVNFQRRYHQMWDLICAFTACF